MALIEGLRPASPTMDQEIIDNLMWAGIPLPELDAKTLKATGFDGALIIYKPQRGHR